MEDQSLGHRSRAGSHLKHHLCSCHTVQCSEPPFTTHRHKPGCQGSVSHQGQPTGPWLIPSCCHCTEPQRDQSWGTQQQQPLTLPCLRAGRAPQHPYPLNTPRRSEHNSSWILTFSTSSLQSCRGHRATGKEISVGDVAKHSALTPTGKGAPWTAGQLQGQASPSPSSSCQIHAPSPHSCTLKLSFTMGEQVHATRASSTPALLPARAATATAFHRLQEKKD